MNKKKTTTKKGDRSTRLCMAQQNWELRETGKFALEKAQAMVYARVSLCVEEKTPPSLSATWYFSRACSFCAFHCLSVCQRFVKDLKQDGNGAKRRR
nr:hypothetical protein CFP56_35265 [Quercus suber]